jgi:hypothetical protein
MDLILPCGVAADVVVKAAAFDDSEIGTLPGLSRP